MGQAASRRWSLMLAALIVALPLTTRAEAPAPPSHAVAAPANPAAFVDTALYDLMVALDAPADAKPGRVERLRLVMARYVDMAELSRNSVGGGAWGQLEPGQQGDFQATVETYLITGYIGSLGAGDVKFTPARVVDTSRAVGDGALVRVDTQPGDGTPAAILFTVRRCDDGSLRIVDISAQSISLGRVLAADFKAFLHRNGDRIGALVAGLHEKIAARTAAR